jgi:hypothetical protein
MLGKPSAILWRLRWPSPRALDVGVVPTLEF